MRTPLTFVFACALVVPAPGMAEPPLESLGCEPVSEWATAGSAPAVRRLQNHQGWAAFEAVRGRDRRYILVHPPDDSGDGPVMPWFGLDEPSGGACLVFRKAVRVRQPQAGAFGPKAGTRSLRVLTDTRCGDDSCSNLVVGLDAKGSATSAVVVTSHVVRFERLQLFEAHPSLLLTAESEAGAGYRHVLEAILHDSGDGLAPLLAGEIGVHEALAPSERAENPGLRCWRTPAGWLKVERVGAEPIVELLEPNRDSENGEGLGTGRRARWEWSTAKKSLVQTQLSKHPYDARLGCRKGPEENK